MHRRVAEDQAPAAEQHLVEGFHQSGVRVTCEASTLTFSMEKLHEVELTGEHFAALEQADQTGRHEHVAVLSDRLGQPAAVRPKALSGSVGVPFGGLEQGVQEAAVAVLRDVVGTLAVAEAKCLGASFEREG